MLCVLFFTLLLNNEYFFLEKRVLYNTYFLQLFFVLKIEFGDSKGIKTRRNSNTPAITKMLTKIHVIIREIQIIFYYIIYKRSTKVGTRFSEYKYSHVPEKTEERYFNDSIV